MEQFGIYGVTEELDDRSAVTASLTDKFKNWWLDSQKGKQANWLTDWCSDQLTGYLIVDWLADSGQVALKLLF